MVFGSRRQGAPPRTRRRRGVGAGPGAARPPSRRSVRRTQPPTRSHSGSSAWRSSTSARPGTSRWSHRDEPASCSMARSTTTSSSARSSSRSAGHSPRPATRGPAQGLAGWGERSAATPQRHVGHRHLRRRARCACCSAETASARSRCTGRRGDGGSRSPPRSSSWPHSRTSRIRLDPGRAAGYLPAAGPTTARLRGSRASISSSPEQLAVDRSAGPRTGPYWDLREAVAASCPSAMPDGWRRRFADALQRRPFASGCGPTCRSGPRCRRASTAQPCWRRRRGSGTPATTASPSRSDDPAVDEGREAGGVRPDDGVDLAPGPGSRRRSSPRSGTGSPGTRSARCPRPACTASGRSWNRPRRRASIVLLDGQGATRSSAATTSSRARSCGERPRPDRTAVAAGARVRPPLGRPRDVLRNGYRYLGRFGRPVDLSARGFGRRLIPPSELRRASGRRRSSMRLADIERWSLPEPARLRRPERDGPSAWKRACRSSTRSSRAGARDAARRARPRRMDEVAAAGALRERAAPAGLAAGQALVRRPPARLAPWRVTRARRHLEA